MNKYIEHFKNLDGFEDIKKQIKQDKFSHSHLILCEDSFSGKIFSMLIAQALLCEANNACMTCGGCKKVLAETHADYYVFPKGKSFVVADAHEIIEKAYTKPINGDKKVFVLNNFDLANQAAQNKILKILEEPPTNTYFVLNAENASKILPTIKSRAQKINLPAFKKDALKLILKENHYDDFNKVLSFSNGFLGKALNLLENQDFYNSYDFVMDVVFKMKSSKDLINFSKTLADRKTFVLKLQIFEDVFRNMLVYKNGKQEILDENQIIDIQNVAEEFSTQAIVRILEKIINAKMHFDANVNINSIADNFLLGMLEVKYLWK